MAGASPPPPNGKMKGILKGLKYISQIFENDKEPEMKIGNPTDVKHVAHIGWDGPSLNSAPSWMNEFQGPQANQSAPLVSSGAGKGMQSDDSIKWVSEDSKAKRGSRTVDSSLRDMPRSSRRSSDGGSGGGSGESPGREKSDKSKQSRRQSKLSKEKDLEGSGKPRKPKEPSQASETDISQKCRRKKSKESSVGGSSRRARQKETDGGSDAGSVTKSRSRELCHPSDVDFEEEEKRLTRVL